MNVLERKNDASDRELRTRQVLLEIGVPDHLRGHEYLLAAIEMAIVDPGAVHGIVKKVYIPVAEKYGSTYTKVERAIRTAIEAAWNRADLEDLRKCFGSTVDPMRGRPTVREFIARLANYIRLEG